MSNLLEKINQLIDKLPPVFTELVKAQMPVLQKAGENELRAWIDLMLKKKYGPAHAKMLEVMETSEVIADGNAVVDALVVLNKQAVSDTQAWEQFFNTIVAVSIEYWLGKTEK